MDQYTSKGPFGPDDKFFVNGGANPPRPSARRWARPRLRSRKPLSGERMRARLRARWPNSASSVATT